MLRAASARAGDGHLRGRAPLHRAASAPGVGSSPRPLRVTVSVGAPLGLLGVGQGGYKIARALACAGADLRVICAGSAPGLLPAACLRIVDLRLVERTVLPWALRLWSGGAMAAMNHLFDWQASRRLEPTDVLYAYSDQALWTMQAARRLGAATVLHAANTHIRALVAELRTEARLHGVRQSWVSSWTVRRVEREYAAADWIRVQSRLVHDSLVAHGIPAAKLLLIPPSVDLERFRWARPADEVFRVAFVGSFDLRKGIYYLLRAWDAAALPHSELILHGGTGSRFIRRVLAPYRQRANVRFRGGDPAATYAEASVCVVPSIEDGFAYVVLEALASGCPVIVTEQVGAKDAVRDGENGYIVPPRDVAALCERLVMLYRAPERRRAMERAARATAEQYSLTAEGQALAAAFKRIRACHAV
ncbi:MAG TPA: glycosyltransferase [Chloroflexota bacterium]|jgi:glycosyltransferase involved in cell wall biosynthesis|nr:glycosyltransferase [Chloroflexota bacterium]